MLKENQRRFEETNKFLLASLENEKLNTEQKDEVWQKELHSLKDKFMKMKRFIDKEESHRPRASGEKFSISNFMRESSDVKMNLLNELNGKDY